MQTSRRFRLHSKLSISYIFKQKYGKQCTETVVLNMPHTLVHCNHLEDVTQVMGSNNSYNEPKGFLVMFIPF